MRPHDIRRAALWLRAAAQAQGVREANARRERLKARARIAEQPRDEHGRWVFAHQDELKRRVAALSPATKGEDWREVLRGL
jgi:hypothetical protein